ncbi:hypothetical protein AB3G33_09110 [Flavobacterium sp. WC2421]|uniref:Uncharacterized protein n=3 Tax=unclassified Flavobacterium TaxID=196869 RepID=A0AB39WA29_9FLAO
MKTIHSLLVLTLVLLSINSVSAQYGNNGYGGYGNGYGGGGYGGGRMGQMSQLNQGPSHDKPKEIPVEVTVGKIMEKLKLELDLDALQEIAISNVLIESIRSQGILIKGETSQEQKIEEIKALSETTDRKINEFLNEDQKVKYKALNEESNSKKRSRRNR